MKTHRFLVTVKTTLTKRETAKRIAVGYGLGVFSRHNLRVFSISNQPKSR